VPRRRGPYRPKSPLAGLRARRGLTLEQAATQLDVTRAHPNKVELGIKVSGRRLLWAMAALYQVSNTEISRVLSLVRHLEFKRGVARQLALTTSRLYRAIAPAGGRARPAARVVPHFRPAPRASNLHTGPAAADNVVSPEIPLPAFQHSCTRSAATRDGTQELRTRSPAG
jgi:transcriptional regulator with XRE-family HTH domain